MKNHQISHCKVTSNSMQLIVQDNVQSYKSQILTVGIL